MKYNDIVMSFSYSANGQPMSITYNGAVYYYLVNAQGDVVGLIDSTGVAVVQYTYDAWGRLLSTSGTAASTLGINNPLRYRSYIYDHETGLYYLQTRYYNPTMGRFINADGYISTGQDILGYNMFAYCGSSPINRADITGQFWDDLWRGIKALASEIGMAIKNMSSYYAVCGGVALSDGPLFFGDIIGFAGVSLITISAVGYGIYCFAQAPAISIPRAEERVEAKPAPSSSPTIIYRYGGTNPSNLTPKEKDMYTGLSFSTVPKPGAAVTTIEALNATGIVYAVKDGATHVSVKPVGATVKDWINAGSESVWTQAVKAVTIKWDGG